MILDFINWLPDINITGFFIIYIGSAVIGSITLLTPVSRP